MNQKICIFLYYSAKHAEYVHFLLKYKNSNSNSCLTWSISWWWDCQWHSDIKSKEVRLQQLTPFYTCLVFSCVKDMGFLKPLKLFFCQSEVGFYNSFTCWVSKLLMDHDLYLWFVQNANRGLKCMLMNSCKYWKSRIVVCIGGKMHLLNPASEYQTFT